MIYGLFIGINNYPGSDADLNGCVNDANDLCNLFKKYCAKTYSLLDNKATKTNIKKYIANITSALKAGDTAIITYSGHGSWIPDLNGDEPDRRDECICPYDTIAKGNYLLDDEINTIFLNRNPKSYVVFITDSCHSGTVAKTINKSKAKSKFLPPIKFLNLSEDEQESLFTIKNSKASNTMSPNIIHLAACSDKEYSYDAKFNNRPNGAFTYFAIKSYLKLSAKSTYLQWMSLIRQNLPSTNYYQTPQLNISTSNKKLIVVGK